MNYRDIWFLSLTLTAFAGNLLYLSYTHSFLPYWIWGGIAATAFILCWIFRRYNYPRLLFISAIIGIGCLTQFYGNIYYSKLPVLLPDGIEKIWIRGEVTQIEPYESHYRLHLNKLDLWTKETKKLPPSQTPDKIRLTVKTKMDGIEIGDYVKLKARLMPPTRLPVHPGAYDFTKRAFTENIGATGFAFSDVTLFDEEKKKANNLAAGRENIRRYVSDNIKNSLAAYPYQKDAVAGTAIALLTGIRGYLSRDEHKVIREAGLGHILAISGLHMALIMGACYWFLRIIFGLIPRLVCYIHTPKLAACVALLCGFLYLQLTGVPVSAERAYIMTSLFFISILLDRRTSLLIPICFAAIIIMIVNPASTLSISFQFSFLAVLSLIIFFQNRHDRPHFLEDHSRKSKLWFYIKNIILSSLLVSFVLAPVSVLHFGTFQLGGVISNIFALPLMSFWIMPFGLLSLILMPFGLEFIGLYPMGFGIQMMLEMSHLIANLDFTTIHLMRPNIWVVVGIYMLLLMLCIIKKYKIWVTILLSPLILILFLPQQRADIIIGAKGKYFAINDNGALYLNNMRFSKFVREQWLSYTNNKSILHLDNHPQCYNTQCEFDKFTLHFDLENSFNITTSANKLHINVQALKNKGVHSIWVEDEEIRVQTVDDKLLPSIWRDVWKPDKLYIKGQ